MKLVLKITSRAGDHAISHVVTEKFPVRIGRAFDNDIILPDPYVSAHHADIGFDGMELTLQDLNSENGVFVATRRVAAMKIKLGSAFRIGQTDIEVFDPHHPLPPALPLQKDNAFLARVSKPPVAWILFATAIAVTSLWTYLEVWTEETGLALAMAAGSAVAAILIWSALWAAAGRLARGVSAFTAQVGVFSLYMILSALCWYVEAYADFLTGENLAAMFLGYALNLALIMPLLSACLLLATQMPARRRRFAAGIFSLGLLAGICLFSIVGKKTFEQEPMYPATLEPYFANLAPAVTPDAFMLENERFFKSPK